MQVSPISNRCGEGFQRKNDWWLLLIKQAFEKELFNSTTEGQAADTHYTEW